MNSWKADLTTPTKNFDVSPHYFRFKCEKKIESCKFFSTKSLQKLPSEHVASRLDNKAKKLSHEVQNLFAQNPKKNIVHIYSPVKETFLSKRSAGPVGCSFNNLNEFFFGWGSH